MLYTILILFFFLLVFAIAGVQLYKGLLKQGCYSVTHGIPWLEETLICGGETNCPSDINGYELICGKMIKNPSFGVVNFDTIFYSFMMVF
jgi:hypothetical protein